MAATGRVLSRRILFFATVIGAVAGVADVAINWRSSHHRVATVEPSIPPLASSSLTTAVEPVTPQELSQQFSPPTPSQERRRREAEESPTNRLARTALPFDFTLRDGEQRTFLGDQASIAAEFNQIGSEDFVTLRVGTVQGSSVSHPILAAGARFPVRVAGRDYSVYVLHVDKTARIVGVRISFNSESQESGGQ